MNVCGKDVWFLCNKPQAKGDESTRSQFMDKFIRDALEVGLRPNSVNGEHGFVLRMS